jgi:hypothetical protein
MAHEWKAKIARHVIEAILNPHFLEQMASYDVQGSICPAPP